MIGMTQANYSRVEKNDKFTPKILYKVAAAMNCELKITFEEKPKA
jgi:hypothetical protein